MTTLTDTLPTASPTSDTAISLFEQVVSDVARRGVGSDPMERMAAVGAAIRDSRWRSYRAGRTRMCGLTGVYWAWAAPDSSWQFAGTPASPIAWRRDGGLFVDVAVWDVPLNDPTVRERVLVARRRASAEFSINLLGVRVLALNGLTRSRFVSPSGLSVALVDSEFWFGGEHRG